MASPEEKNPDNISGIKKLSEKLYGRAIPKETEERRHKLRENYKDIASGWSVPTQKLSRLRVGYSAKPPSLLIGLFLFSMLFFVLAFGLASYLFFSGGNAVSNDRIDVEITGPVASPAGEELSLSLEIVNRNSASLLLTDLLAEWPEGTRSPVDRKTEQPRTAEELGDIAPGKSIKTTVRGVLFGEENEVKDITFNVQYRVEGSNAIFSKDVVYHVTLSSAPIVLRVSAPPEMVSGQEATITADIISNATMPLKNVMLLIQYPFGFKPNSADPETAIDNNIWSLGDFEPGEQKRVKLSGTLVAQHNEDRAFHFRIGSQSNNNEREFGVLFGEIVKTIIVKRPFIATSLEIDNSTKEPFTVNRGKIMRGTIQWTNTLPGKILDIEVEVKFAGNSFDKKSVRGSGGSYRSIDNTLFWNKNTLEKLKEMEPGKTISVDFDFASTALAANTALENPNVLLEVEVRATRLRETDEAPETISTKIAREVRVHTDLFMAAQSFQTIGPITNFGPFPPRAEQETSYTITWSVQNSANDLANVTAFGTLPVNVRYTGVVSPAGERVSFNADNRMIRWDIGNVPHGTGYASPIRTMSFQVAVLPNVKEVGAILNLVTNQGIVGTDRYSGDRLTWEERETTTEVRGDPAGKDRSYYQVQP